MNAPATASGLTRLQSQRAEPVQDLLWLLQGGVLSSLVDRLRQCRHLSSPVPMHGSGEFAMRLALRRNSRRTRAAVARRKCAAHVPRRGRAGSSSRGAGLSTANHFTAQLLPDALPFGLDSQVLDTRPSSPQF